VDKIVITSDEIKKNSIINSSPVLHNQCVPLWWRFLSGLFILVPPILFLIIIISLIINRHKNISVKYSYTFHYCFLLIISGIIWIFLWTLFTNDVSDKIQKSLISDTPISIKIVPQLPSSVPFSGKDVASEFSPMVIAIHNSLMVGIPNNDRVCGAGAIIAIRKEGCLVLTSKHIIDALVDYQNEKQDVVISLNDGQLTNAKVVGIHRDLDLSLLLISKMEDTIYYLQPIRKYNTIEAGESVFVIGHPEGLAFSISNGLVSQKRNEELIQISAPVSPGNSGGPVYDEYGNLIGIVQSVLDKTKKPNAENLNFAVRADAIFKKENWYLTDIGNKLISIFSSNNNDSTDDYK
jgi:S1-C subfamily serine protease